MATRYVSNWEDWKKLCEHYDFDPYKTVEFGLDEGGGNSTDFEYTGDIPKKEE